MKITVLIMILLMAVTIIQAREEVIIDTLRSVDNLSGMIVYYMDFDAYQVFYQVAHSGSIWSIGDAYNPIYWTWTYSRAYMSFPVVDHGSEFELTSAKLSICLWGSCGNDTNNVWPTWETGNLVYDYPLIVDHVNMGNTFDYTDFNGTSFQENIGSIFDTLSYHRKSLEVLNNYQEDLDNNRNFSQYRLRFPVNTDDDELADYVDIYETLTHNSVYSPESPYLLLTWQAKQGTADNVEEPELDFTISPNPLREAGNIVFSKSSGDSGKEIQLYNMKGQRVNNANIQRVSKFEYKVDCKNLTSGIYLLKVKTKEKEIIKKITLMR